MQDSNKPLQLIGVPYTALLSVIFGLLLVSFPIGIYVVFETNVGGDINYEYPLTHLELFEGTDLYQISADVSVGDAFVVLWVLYLVLFVIAVLGPRNDFLKTLSPIISYGRCDTRTNYMMGVIKWFSILILISALITLLQARIGISIVPPMVGNDLVQFFYLSLSPLFEEFGFRLILTGIPLFVLYSSRASVKYFLRCLWTPDALDIRDSKRAFLLIVFVGVFFGFAHVAFADSWSGGKFTQATAGGIILGWVYLRYGFVASLLIHWATNYFIFSYAYFISQINQISINAAFSHSLMSTLEILFLITGLLSVAFLLAQKFYSRTGSDLEV